MKKTILVSLREEEPFFPTKMEINKFEVNISKFSDKLNAIKSLEPVLNAGTKDYFEEIAETKAKGFKTLNLAALKLISKELGLNIVNPKDKKGLKDRIIETKNTQKSSLPTPKPKF